MQQKQGHLITQAEYARLRKLNRSTVSRQVKKGYIPTIKGLIDPVVADQARLDNLALGQRQDAARRKAERRSQAPAAISPAAIQTAPVGDRRDVVVSVLHCLAAPSEAFRVARVALRSGCSAMQAFVLAKWWTIQPSLCIEGLDDQALDEIGELTDAQWLEFFGKDFPLEAAHDMEEQVTFREYGPERENVEASAAACVAIVARDGATVSPAPPSEPMLDAFGSAV